MIVWTINELSDLVEDLPKRVFSRDEVWEKFLRYASLNDGLLTLYNQDSHLLLSRAKAKGINGPVVLLSDENIEDEEIKAYNAVCLNRTFIDQGQLKSLLQFIFNLSFRQAPVAFKIETPEFPTEEIPKSRPVINSNMIQEVVNYVVQKDLSIVLTFHVMEEGNEVVARGVCKIKPFEDGLKLYKFRPIFAIHGLEDGEKVKAVLPYREVNYETDLTIKKVEENHAISTMPKYLVLERRRHVRVVPSVRNPIRAYTLPPGGPTLSLMVQDISQKGLGVTCSEEFNRNDVFIFSIALPYPESTVMSYGIIRFKGEVKDRFRYGIELSVHPKDEETISQYITKREMEILELLREM